jgi:hypothetical protein
MVVEAQVTPEPHDHGFIHDSELTHNAEVYRDKA